MTFDPLRIGQFLKKKYNTGKLASPTAIFSPAFYGVST